MFQKINLNCFLNIELRKLLEKHEASVKPCAAFNDSLINAFLKMASNIAKSSETN